jgi:tetratricopeptide (TPR) repeat protein
LTEQREVKYLTATSSVQEEVETDEELLAAVQILQKGGDLFDEKLLLEAVSSFDRLIQRESNNYLYCYYLGRAQATLINLYDFLGDKDKMGEGTEMAIRAFKESIRLNDKFSEAHSYLGVIYGQKINQEGSLAGMLYGGKVKKAHRKALKLEPLNPIVQINNGINYLYTPTAWGGDREKAKECFEKAIQIAPNFVDGYIWLGILYEMKDKEKAQESYKKALAINPNNWWAKSKLEKLDK